MKTNGTLNVCKNALLLVVVFFTTNVASSQAPIYRFTNYALVSGTDKQVNALYRFSNVITGVDALVRIQAISGNITLRSIDRTNDGYGEAFQPEYRIGGTTNAYIEFLITFVHAGNSTNYNQPQVAATGLDIDGDALGVTYLKEFNRIDMGGGTYSFNNINSQVSIAQNGTAYTASNITGILFGALVDTSATEVMFTVSKANVTSFTYRVGANNLLPNTSNRYASLYFKAFSYPAFPLAIPKLKSFEGNLSNKKVNLNWEFETAEGLTNCVLERSNNTTGYETAAYFMLTKEANTGGKFSYKDAIQENGNYYYRLKMTGTNGEVKYSNVLAFSTKASATNEIKVFPVLIKSSATVNINVNQSETAVFRVTDMNGRIMKQQQVNLQKGSNSINQNGFEKFNNGNYVVSVSTSQGIFSKQVIINQ